jgi:hypothetical protein
MTVSRAFALLDDDTAAAAPPVFPLWPYACIAYADHCSRDYADYMGRLAHAEEPWVAEEALGLHMLEDMNRAFFSLMWAPLGVAMMAAGETSPRP